MPATSTASRYPQVLEVRHWENADALPACLQTDTAKAAEGGLWLTAFQVSWENIRSVKSIYCKRFREVRFVSFQTKVVKGSLEGG